MNWGGFPVAFRFPVKDFSFETRKRCWDAVLSALTYADLTDTALYEATSAELFDPERLIYMPAIAPKNISPNRKNSLLWRQDGELMSHLVLYQPVAQENYLELHTVSKKLADMTPERAIVLQEGAEGLFPDRIESKPKTAACQRALILPKGELPYAEREELCRRAMRELYKQDDSSYLKMLPLSPGGEGAVYTAAAFLHGRLFSEMILDRNGRNHRVLFGVLPGRTLLIDGFTVPDMDAPLDEDYGLGQAVRVARNRGFTDVRLCATGLKAPECEAKPEKDVETLYALSRELPLYDKVILAEYGSDGQIKTETIEVDRRDQECALSILSRRNGTAAN